MLRINLEYRKGILFVRLKGNLTENTSDKFMDYTLPLIRDCGIKYLVYNLDNIYTLDDVGKSALIESSKCVKKNNGKVLIVNNNKLSVCLDKISSELAALNILKV